MERDEWVGILNSSDIKSGIRTLNEEAEPEWLRYVQNPPCGVPLLLLGRYRGITASGDIILFIEGNVKVSETFILAYADEYVINRHLVRKLANRLPYLQEKLKQFDNVSLKPVVGQSVRFRDEHHLIVSGVLIQASELHFKIRLPDDREIEKPREAVFVIPGPDVPMTPNVMKGNFLVEALAPDLTALNALREADKTTRLTFDARCLRDGFRTIVLEIVNAGLRATSGPEFKSLETLEKMQYLARIIGELSSNPKLAESPTSNGMISWDDLITFGMAEDRHWAAILFLILREAGYSADLRLARRWGGGGWVESTMERVHEGKVHVLTPKGEVKPPEVEHPGA